jgi:hypothetical protein
MNVEGYAAPAREILEEIPGPVRLDAADPAVAGKRQAQITIHRLGATRKCDFGMPSCGRCGQADHSLVCSNFVPSRGRNRSYEVTGPNHISVRFDRS